MVIRMGGVGKSIMAATFSRMLLTAALRHTLIPPRGYTLGGISGSCGPWVDGFSLIITR